MLATRTLAKRTLAKSHACAVFFSSQNFTNPKQYGILLIPDGLRCHMIREGSQAGKFFLDELPLDLFPRNSMIRHDALYYGVTLERSQVKDITVLA